MKVVFWCFEREPVCAVCMYGNVFAACMCSHANCFCSAERRRKTSHKPLVLSEARKQLLIYRLPQVLRLHLKRFRSVAFTAALNLE